MSEDKKFTPTQLNNCNEDGTIPFTQEDRDEIVFAGNQIVMRVVAELIKKLPEKDRNEIISLIEEHGKAFDKDNAIPQIGNDEDFDRFSMANAKAANDFLEIINSPDPVLRKGLKR
ncbi:hypothetical protein APT_02084 [Acetobacter pasteurianus NBRC 101655]|nr:hypothetical protein APT_02084 [Acetobacter pasteurianus NBRC 101655]